MKAKKWEAEEAQSKRQGGSMNVVSFSGGKDSTAMLLMMLAKKIKIDKIICIDTTKEFPEMYMHINRVQLLCPVEIEIVKIDFDYFFSEHKRSRGKRMHIRGYGWPDMRNRWCTSLKRDASNKIISSIAQKGEEIIEFHVIAYDEKESAIKIKAGLYGIRWLIGVLQRRKH